MARRSTGAMIPQLFGESATPLYGVFHPSAKGGTARTAAVLCAPFGNEYLQAHRVLRKLADELSGRGIPSLRFDYLGTGDSFGDGDAVSLEQMATDTAHAIGEVRGLTRARKVVLVAMRGGAFPALRSIGEASVVGCVLWDPITRVASVVSRASADSVSGGAAGMLSLGGFPLSATLQRELATFDPGMYGSSGTRDLRVVAHTEAEIASLRTQIPTLEWVRTADLLDFGAPGSQDLVHASEAQVTLVANAVESISQR